MSTPSTPQLFGSFAARAAVICGVAAAIVWGDQITKQWADQSLASPRHPLPVRVSQPTPIADAVAASLSTDAAEARALVEAGHVLLLPAEPVRLQDHPAYPPGARSPHRELFVFLRGLDRAPRRVYLYHRAVLRRWLSLATRDLPRQRVDEAIDGALGSRDYASWVAEIIGRGARDGRARAAFEAGHVFSADQATTVRPGDTLAPDRIAVVVHRPITVIDGFFRFVYAENPGAAWSFLANAPATFRFWFFSTVSSLAALMLLGLGLFQRDATRVTVLAYALILGGAIGNLIDRVQTNYVIDFIDNYIGTSHWPTYNIADSGITVGIILLLCEQLFGRRPDA